MANRKKQYYTNLNPGETAIESRLGAKIVMDQKGGIALTTSRRSEYLDQLRQENYEGNITPNPDEENSYLYVGTGQVDLNQQGNINQQSLDIENKTSNSVITPSPDKTSEDLPPSEETPTDPPTIDSVKPIEAFKGDRIKITGSGFIKGDTTVTLGGISVDSISIINSREMTVVVGKGASGDIIVKTSNGSTTYKDKFVYKGVQIETTDEDDVVTEEELEELNQIDEGDGCTTCPDQNEEPDNSPVEVPTNPLSTACTINPTIILNHRPINFTDSLPRNSVRAITPYQDFCAAAKASVGTSTRYVAASITENGALGCATAVSIIYLRATGHSIDWIDKKKPSTKIGKIVGGSTGTASVLNHMRRDKANWQMIKVFEMGAPGALGDWNAAWQQFQPGDCINTVTLGAQHGHIGWVIDTKKNDGIAWDVSNNKPGCPCIDDHWSVKTWSWIAKLSTKKGKVGPTYLFRFIGTWGVTISVP